MIKISVVIPVYNREKCICATINSVLRQTLREIEVVCVDDGSTDYSLNLIREAAKQDNRVRVFHQENTGPGIARNNGIKYSVGEYIAFLDSDDRYFDEDALQVLFKKKKKNSSNICGGNLVYENSDGIFQNDSKYVFDSGLLDFYYYQYDSFFQRFIYKRSFLEDNSIHFPDLRNYEDPVFLLDAMLKARRFYYINRDVYIYNRQHIENVQLNERAAIDGLKGIGRNLRISDSTQLKDLHVRTHRYLLSFIYSQINRLLPSDNSALFYELIRCNSSINVDWIKEAEAATFEPLLLPPLVTIWNAGNQYLKIRKKSPFNWIKKHRG